MRNDNVFIFDSVEKLAAFFTEKLADFTQTRPDGAHASVALSGGSTPRAVFAYLSKQQHNSVLWNKVKLFWGDERCVPPDHAESNYRMTKESLLSHVPLPVENIFRIQGEDDPHAEAIRYSKLVAGHVPFFNNQPVFDLVMLGLGEDGHTASIFPPDMHLFDSPNLFVAVQNPYSGQHRITATGRVINHAKHVFFIVSGTSKAEMVARIINKREGFDRHPASKVKPLGGEPFWLLDQEAASSLRVA